MARIYRDVVARTEKAYQQDTSKKTSADRLLPFF